MVLCVLRGCTLQTYAIYFINEKSGDEEWFVVLLAVITVRAVVIALLHWLLPPPLLLHGLQGLLPAHYTNHKHDN